MSITKTVITLPPAITQHYNKILLSVPCKFNEDSETLQTLYLGWLKMLAKKSKSGKYRPPIDLGEKMKEFEVLYHSIKAKEKNIEAEKNHPTKMPFYHFGYLDRKSEDLYWRFGRKAEWGRFSKFQSKPKNDEVY